MSVLLVTGFIRQARYLAALLNAQIPDARAYVYGDRRTALIRAAARAVQADAAITFGGPEPKALIRAICEARRRPVIHIWAGTDVLEAARSPGQAERLRVLSIVHWAVTPQLVSELAALGIDARCVTVASAPVPETPALLPERFTVLTYLPQPRREFYGQGAIWQAARAMPEVRFIAIGAGRPEPAAPPNLEYVGEVARVEQYIDAASVLVRMTEHDGLSQNVIEALSRGRYVIWTYPYPGALRARSRDELIERLQGLYVAHTHGTLGVNRTGIDYARANHDPKAVARALYGGITGEIDRVRAAERDTHAMRIAISGAPAFSARVALNWRSYDKHVIPKLLSTHTNSDTAVSVLTLLRSKAWYSVGEPAAPRSLELTALACRKRRIVHWLGNDVQTLVEAPVRARRYRSGRFVHFAQDEEVARRLGELGLQASVVSVPALPHVDAVRPLPERFTLLLYVPADRPQLYGRHQYERLMRSLVDEHVHYIVVGGGAIDVPAGVSVEHIGWLHDLRAVYERCTVLVRFTQTDSFSAMVIEALLCGRYVLWSNDFPYTTRLRDFHDLEDVVRSLLVLHGGGALRPQYDAAKAMGMVYSPETSIKSFAAACVRA